MSYEAVDWSFKQRGLSPPQSAVLRCLAHHLNERTRQCNPGMQLISEETGFGQTAVKKAISELETMGLIVVDRGRRRGQMRSNRYVLQTARTVTAHDVRAMLSVTSEDSHSRLAAPASAEVRRSPEPLGDHGQSRHATMARAAARPRPESPDDYGRGRVAAPNKEEENKEALNPQAREHGTLNLPPPALIGTPRAAEITTTEYLGAVARTLGASQPRGIDPTQAPRVPVAASAPKPWRGEEASLDVDGWGLDINGEPLQAAVAADAETLARRSAAMARHHASAPPGPRLRLITPTTLLQLRVASNGGSRNDG